MLRYSTLFFVSMSSLALTGPMTGKENNPLDFSKEMAPMLEKHCAECHMDGNSEGGMSFEGLDSKSKLLEKEEMFRKISEVVEFGDMPPFPEDTSYSKNDSSKILSWINDKITTIDPSDEVYKDPGPAVVRPLTPTEYENTISTLLDVKIDLEETMGIIEEIPAHGFSNLANNLSMDPSVLEKYFSAADKILETFASEEHKDKRLKVFGVYPKDQSQIGPAAKAILTKVARKAYRRPVNSKMVANLGRIFADEFAKDKNFDLAIAKALKPVLISPMFLFRMEKPTPSEGYKVTESSYRISDAELAVRLSYFLWADMPDLALQKAVAEGRLKTTEGLRAEVNRLLSDPKARGLKDVFADQWLQVYKLDEALPSPDIYPDFTDELREDMRKETVMFFEELVANDGSILDFLNADYTFLNENLANHYGIKGVRGKEFRKVKLLPEHNRGGLLGMGSFLASTSHTDRTKPTLRGTYILEVLLGTPPTPPPAEVSVFKKEPGKEVVIENFRDQLNFHASDPNCASCHKKIDPLGFALENFDPIGRYYESIDGRPIDNNGVLPTGEDVSGFNKLRDAMVDRQDLFLTNVTSQLLSYALGREVSYYDRLTVQTIVGQLKKNDYRFSELIHGITESLQFQHRRKLTPQTANNEN